MANGRNSGRKVDRGRDSGGFVALPWSVLDCVAYSNLAHPARTLLLEFARQFVRDNNGRLLCSMNYLRKRGWRSADVVTRAKRDLLEAGFIFETVKGRLPNRAAWYAVTWRALDPHPEYDPGTSFAFERGAYRLDEITVPVPSNGTRKARTVLSGGIRNPAAVLPPGTVNARFKPAVVPADGNHLEMPSALACQPEKAERKQAA